MLVVDSAMTRPANWPVCSLSRPQTVGKYMIEIWRAAGMDMNNVQFLWASEEVRDQKSRKPGVRCWLSVLSTVKPGDGRINFCRCISDLRVTYIAAISLHCLTFDSCRCYR